MGGAPKYKLKWVLNSPIPTKMGSKTGLTHCLVESSRVHGSKAEETKRGAAFLFFGATPQLRCGFRFGWSCGTQIGGGGGGGGSDFFGVGTSFLGRCHGTPEETEAGSGGVRFLKETPMWVGPTGGPQNVFGWCYCFWSRALPFQVGLKLFV